MGNHAPVIILDIKLIDTGKGYDLFFNTQRGNIEEFFSCFDDALEVTKEYLEDYRL